jgi:hypothetical protein
MLQRHSDEQFVSQPLNPILMYGKMKAIFHFNGRHYPDPLVVLVGHFFPSVAEQKKATQPPVVVKTLATSQQRRINMAAGATTTASAAALAVRPAQIDTQSMD